MGKSRTRAIKHRINTFIRYVPACFACSRATLDPGCVLSLCRAWFCFDRLREVPLQPVVEKCVPLKLLDEISTRTSNCPALLVVDDVVFVLVESTLANRFSPQLFFRSFVGWQTAWTDRWGRTSSKTRTPPGVDLQKKPSHSSKRK